MSRREDCVVVAVILASAVKFPPSHCPPSACHSGLYVMHLEQCQLKSEIESQLAMLKFLWLSPSP